MASLDKSSVREEIDHLKAQFEQLSAQDKLSSEAKVLFNSLLLIVDLILSIFLERQTRKNTRNSSLPSSQTDKDESALPLTGSHGKGKRLRGQTARNRSQRETVTLASVDHCDVCGEPLGKVACQHIEQLIALPAMHVDETSLRVEGKNHWIHVYAAGDITVKRLHRIRGTEAIEDINIIPRYGGKAIHDCRALYLAYDHLDHALCGSHLLRELEFIIETNGYAWARNMKRLLQQTAAKVSSREAKQLTDTELANLQKRYRHILTRADKELPALPQRPTGKRGRLANSDAHNLWERLKKHEAAVLLFAREPYVAFTHNRAERDLRMAKVKQKVSGCFRTELHANAYCRLSRFLQTMASRGYNPLIAIQMALAGEFPLRGE